jgi:hypothetical protein
MEPTMDDKIKQLKQLHNVIEKHIVEEFETPGHRQNLPPCAICYTFYLGMEFIKKGVVKS